MRFLKLSITFIVIFAVASGIILAKSRPHVTVFSVSGTTEYLPAGETQWKNIKIGLAIYSGDNIKTYEDSSVDIAFDDKKKNIVNIKSNTHVVIKLQGEEKIELIDGEVFYLVKMIPRGSRFEIRTPTAVCGARGTGGGAKANKDRTVVSAYENDSYAKGIGKDGKVMEDNLTVKEGFKTIVKLFQRPSALKGLTDKEKAKWDKWKDELLRLFGRSAIMRRLADNLEKIQNAKERMEERKDADRIDKKSEKSGAGGGRCNGETKG
ncbi:MAG: FecR domain-containing protein [Candidatus Omnitrophica bacterium]|nr:FecR domain-containing protein [Candidatus Omnitrophota bacterium]